MNKKRLILILITLIVVLGASSLYINSLVKVNSGYVGEGQLVDMIGRSVDVPTTINKVAGLSHSTTVIIYMLAPDTLLGWDSTRVYTQNKYMDSKYSSLPYLGGGKKDANYENYIKVAPDLVFIGHGGELADINTFQQKLGSIALVDVEGDNNLSTITQSIEFIGKVLKKEEKANKLIEFYNNYSAIVDERVKNIPDASKKRVYYTNDANGLKSFSEGSQHTELIEKCGGKNVVEVPISKGTSGISIEQILEWNPDIIIASDPNFYNNVYSNPLWKDVKAVKNKEVYLIPQSPFSWFDNPPGVNNIIGIPWTAKVLYPDKFQDIDMNQVTNYFYSEFYHYNLSDNEISEILNSSNLKS